MDKFYRQIHKVDDVIISTKMDAMIMKSTKVEKLIKSMK